MREFCIKINEDNYGDYVLYKKSKNGTMIEFEDNRYIDNKYTHEAIIFKIIDKLVPLSLRSDKDESYCILQLNGYYRMDYKLFDSTVEYNNFLRAIAGYNPNMEGRNNYILENRELSKFVLIKSINSSNKNFIKSDHRNIFIKFNIITFNELIKTMLKERETTVIVDGRSIPIKYNLLHGLDIRFLKTYEENSDTMDILMSTFYPIVEME